MLKLPDGSKSGEVFSPCFSLARQVSAPIDFMHDHECRHCRRNFICGEADDVCFARFITCQDCWWKYDVRQFGLFFLLVMLAIGMTLYAFKFWR